MEYEIAKANHGMKHDPFKALMVPRPIGWISTVSRDGVFNLAPYSFFNAVSDRPTYVMFSSSTAKDSMRNAAETGEFVCSLATWELREQMNVTSAPVPPDVDEFPISGLTATKSSFVAPPRVKESPAAFECKHWKTIELPPGKSGAPASYVVFGEVVGIYLDDEFIKDGLVDTGAMRPISRLGYMDYGVLNPENVFTINRPVLNEAGEIVSTSADSWDGSYR